MLKALHLHLKTSQLGCFPPVAAAHQPSLPPSSSHLPLLIFFRQQVAGDGDDASCLPSPWTSSPPVSPLATSNSLSNPIHSPEKLRNVRREG
eukprot:420538-Hanusia_phi.AAC.1